MPREPNTPIGTCPCPTKGCELTAKVYRYRQRNDMPGRARHAGKLYVVCTDHGRLDPQEFILEHATIDRTGESAPAPVAEPAPTQKPAAERKPAAPKPAPAQPARERETEKGGFGFYD